MTVTAIRPLTKAKSRIELEDETEFILYKGEIRSMHITEGEELTEELYEEIMGKILPDRARLRCMNLLKSRDYTRSQLEDKLKSGGYPYGVILNAIEYVESYGYLDDLRYAEKYIMYHSGSRSRRRLSDDLKQKGVSGDLIEQAFQKAQEDGNAPDEETMIKSLLIRKHYDPETSDYKEKQKMLAFLYRKGFSTETIRHVINSQGSDEIFQ